MDLEAVMEELGTRLNTIDGVTGFGYPPSTIVPPAAFADWPEDITFDGTYQRGSDSMTIPVVVVVGKVVDVSTRNQLAAYCAGSGTSSIKEVIESGTYTAFDVVRVTGAEFEIWTIGTVDYMAARFTLDIAGAGA